MNLPLIRSCQRKRVAAYWSLCEPWSILFSWNSRGSITWICISSKRQGSLEWIGGWSNCAIYFTLRCHRLHQLGKTGSDLFNSYLDLLLELTLPFGYCYVSCIWWHNKNCFPYINLGNPHLMPRLHGLAKPNNRVGNPLFWGYRSYLMAYGSLTLVHFEFTGHWSKTQNF